MKILYLKLVNVANIDTAQNASEIEIDFRQCKNKIILLTGPNGSGKTTILSCLHPFATNGNLDIRSENSLIIEGKSGFKQIIYLDSGSEYDIRHFYSPNGEKHTVKSYISRDGVELNPNGNVTSFMSVVQAELDIEIDYLKLVRLGSNVTNFIDQKATDRKAFMGKIMDEVEIYLKYFKKVTNDMREMKSLMSHTIDKLNKLNVTNPDELKDKKKRVDELIISLETDLTRYTQEEAVLCHELSNLGKRDEIKDELTRLYKDNDKISKLLKDNEEYDIAVFNEQVETLSSTVMVLNSKIILCEERRTMYVDQLNSMFNERNQLLVDLDNANNDEEIASLNYIIENLTTRVDSRKEQFKKFAPEYSKKELEEVITLIQTCQTILDNTYEFGREPIKQVIDLLLKEKDVNKYIIDSLDTVQTNKLANTSNFVFEKLMKKFPLLYPNCDDKSCSLYRFWKEFYDLASLEPDKSVKTEEYYKYMELINRNINEVLHRIKEKESLIRKIPLNIQSMLYTKNLLERISECKIVYNQPLVYKELSMITEFEIFMDDYAQLTTAKEQLEKAVNASKKSAISKRLSDLEETISSLSEKIDNNNQELLEHRQNLVKTKENLELARDIKSALEIKDDITVKITHKLQEFEDVTTKTKKLIDVQERLTQLNFDISAYRKESNNLMVRYNDFKSLTKELKKINEDYDETELIRKSLSSKEGIPLVYIELYLKDTRETTNELLDMVYNGSIYLDKFDINADEFRIPYIKNNKKIKDVTHASQGEQDFITLALSFALSHKALTRYNIMLLDEIDATLDTENRAKFIKILEHQMEMVGSEQNFLITHNNMFDMYPVDIVDMSFDKKKQNKLANYIEVKMKAA